MRVLTLTYPLTPVSRAACGGTEQIALQLLRRLGRSRGLEYTWVGAEGSRADQAGVACVGWSEILERFHLARPRPQVFTPEALTEFEARCSEAATRLARGEGFALVHNQGAPPPACVRAALPVLLTLHLARRLYPQDMGADRPRNWHWQCVSRTQAAGYGAEACCGVIANGVSLERIRPRRKPPGGNAPLLYLGRICPEKAPHLAIAIARRARRRLWLAGSVAPFRDHQRYFAEAIAPELDGGIRWSPPPPEPVKLAMIAAAAVVVIPSCIEETSSLVAMEAAAVGVPVLALRVGALPEIVAEGETGYLADTWEDLADRLTKAERLSPQACRRHAAARFSAQTMAENYLELYRRLAAGRVHP